MILEDQPAWNTHIRSSYSLRTSPKRHFKDVSLAVAALAANQTTLLNDLKFTGFLFESMVVHDLRVYAQANDAKLQHYRAPVLFRVCTRYCVFATDNLEFYPLIKFQATNADGSKKKQEVLHTANTIQYPLPVELTKDDVPDFANWPFLKQWNLQEAILTDEKLREVLSKLWKQAELHSDGDDLSYMRKPHESSDKKQNFGEHGKKNPSHVLPILINVGTHSTADCQKIIEHIRTVHVHDKEVKKLVGGDMQTFKNLLLLLLFIEDCCDQCSLLVFSNVHQAVMGHKHRLLIRRDRLAKYSRLL